MFDDLNKDSQHNPEQYYGLFNASQSSLVTRGGGRVSGVLRVCTQHVRVEILSVHRQHEQTPTIVYPTALSLSE